MPRNRSSVLWAATLVLLTACDQRPTPPTGPDHKNVTLEVTLTPKSHGATRTAALSEVRYTLESQRGTVLRKWTARASSLEAPVTQRLDLPLPLAEPGIPVLRAEAVAATGEGLEWVGEVPLTLGESSTQPVALPMLRGPRENLKVQKLSLTLAQDTFAVGDTLVLSAQMEPVVEGAKVFFGVEPSALATVSGNQVVVLGAGEVTVVAAAGPVADTAKVTFLPRYRSLHVRPDTVKFASLGDTLTLKALALDHRGQEIENPADLRWELVSGGGAMLGSNGLLTSSMDGTTLVRAVLGELMDTAVVLVKQVTVEITLSRGPSSLAAGDTVRFSAIALDARGRMVVQPGYVWSSSSPEVGSINAEGLFSALKPGTTTITVASGGVSQSATVSVVAGAAAQVKLVSGDAQSDTVAKTLTQPIRVQVLDKLGNPVANAGVQWTTTHGSVSAAETTTDAQGYAEVRWTLGTLAGAAEATAQLANGQSVKFTAKALAGPIASLALSPDTLHFKRYDETAQMKATAKDVHGNVIQVALTWATNPTQVVQVTQGGQVVPKSEGLGYVIASSGSVRDSSQVRVKPDVASLSIVGDTAALGTGTTRTFGAQPKDYAGNVLQWPRVSWSSSNTAVLSVDAEGQVTGVAPGTAELIATSEGKTARQSLTVRQGVLTSLELVSGNSQTGTVGTSLMQPLAVRAKDDMGYPMSGVSITWGSAGGSISGGQTTDADGLAEAMWTLGPTAGAVSATASAGAGSALNVTFAATANPGPLARLIPSPTSVSLTSIGETATLSVSGQDQYENAVSTGTLTWTSRDPAIASVTSAGLIEAVMNGNTYVVFASGSVKDSVAVSVQANLTAMVVTPRIHEFNALTHTTQLTAEGRDQNGNPVPVSATWTSGNTAVASVNSSGLVTAVGTGRTWVHAVSGAFRDSADITVTQVPAALNLSADRTTLAANDTVTVSGLVVDSASNVIPGSTITWGVTDPSVLSVTSAGLVTALAPGTANVTATSGMVGSSIEITVSGSGGGSLTLGDGGSSNQSVVGGGPLPDPLKVKYIDANGNPISGATISWSASAGTLSASSSVTDATGHTSVSWSLPSTAGVYTASASINASNFTFYGETLEQADSVVISPDSAMITAFNMQLNPSWTATAYKGGNTMPATLTWTVADTTVAFVDENGVPSSKRTNGSTTVQACHGATCGTAKLVVQQVVVRVDIGPDAQTATVGQGGGSTCMAFDGGPNGGWPVDGVTFTYSSSDSNIIAIDPNNGAWTVKAAGTVTLSCTGAGFTDSTTVTVSAS